MSKDTLNECCKSTSENPKQSRADLNPWHYKQSPNVSGQLNKFINTGIWEKDFGNLEITGLKPDSAKFNETIQRISIDMKVENSNKIKTPSEIGKSCVLAYQTGDFSIANNEIKAAVISAHQEGGTKAIDEFYKQLNDATSASPGSGPLFIKNGNRMEIHHVKQLSEQNNRSCQQMSAEERARLGIFYQEGAGWLQNLTPPLSFDLPELTQSLPPPAELGMTEMLGLEAATGKFGQELNAQCKQELKSALSAVLKGDLAALSKMVPYGENSISLEAREAFAKALKYSGIEMQVDGFAARCIGGEAHGSITLVKNGNGIKLAYDREEGMHSKGHYTVTAVTVHKEETGRLHFDQTTIEPTRINSSMKEIAQELKKGFRQITSPWNSNDNSAK